jgi:hypothetical protein
MSEKKEIPVIRLLCFIAGAMISVSPALAQTDEARKIEEWLKGYDAAFIAKDSARTSDDSL